MKREYEAVLSCPCGYTENLSDKDYLAIINEEKAISLKCGHLKYFAKIRAKHKADPSQWRMVRGTSAN